MENRLEKELTEQRVKLEKVQALADRFPIFEDYIFKNMKTSETGKFGDRYKGLRLDWGINRYLYKSNTNITNYNKPYKGYLFNIYINSLNIYDSHKEYGLYKAMESVEIFHCDTSNTSFYIEDNHIEAVLEALSAWHTQAKVLAHIDWLTNRIEEEEKHISIWKVQLEEAKKI